MNPVAQNAKCTTTTLRVQEGLVAVGKGPEGTQHIPGNSIVKE